MALSIDDILSNSDLIIFFLVLLAMFVLFIVDKWRYDVVALVALLILTVAGVIAPEDTFAGFGHPAVITVAAVLVVSRGLQNAGLVDVIGKAVSKVGDNFLVQLSVLTTAVTILSAFMNNIAAVAILIPVAIGLSRKSEKPASLYLMPLAFGSLLGGLITIIGSPTNIIIGMARADYYSEPFGMFDLASVGISVTVVGLLFMLLVGWRLLPTRENAGKGELIANINDYITEIRVPEGSELIGKRVSDLQDLSDNDANILKLIRNGNVYNAPSAYKLILEGDILVVKASTEDIEELVSEFQLELSDSREFEEDLLKSEEVEFAEVVVSRNSFVSGKTAQGLRLHHRYGVNLLAISREGQDFNVSVDSVRLRAGDLLLLQGPRETLHQSISDLGLIPLASGEIAIGRPRKVLLAVALFALGLAAAALNVFPIATSLTIVAVVMLLIGMVPVKDLYKSIDWPIIVLLGALMPLGAAFEQVGGSTLIVDALLNFGGSLSPLAILAILMVLTMLLSAVVNNAAVAILMAPVAFELSLRMGVSADPFLVGIAVGASCAFLTPIAHQSNRLVMGPGGYLFTDYWKLGLPLQVITAVVGMIAIMTFWPF
jgi:di/tricarboxylate transporter